MKTDIKVIEELVKKLQNSFNNEELKEILDTNNEITESFLENKKVHDN